MSLAQKYHDACRTPSDINEHLTTFVKMCRELDATKVIELGTRGGVSTIAWLYAMEETDGHVWSVDIDPAPDLEHKRWTFIQGDDLDPAVTKQVPESADVVFIDTEHSYEQTLAELNVYSWYVRPGGKIVLHDTELLKPFGLRHQPPYPVKKAVEDFCREEVLPWKNYPNNNGLAIIDMPEG